MSAHSLPHAGAAATRDSVARNRRHIRLWLYLVLLVLAAIVFVGGATRMTGSGLSITEWKPIHGVIPPIGEAEWMEEFDKYRQIPQYQQINKGMSLAEFKQIFWWEWAHRLLARGVGFLVALPLAFFWLTGRLERALKPRMVGILALGGLQGAVGWWMVASGLVDRVDVSQYRLATHLTLACIIFAAVMYVARGLAEYTDVPADRPVQRFAGWMVLFIFVQIYLGALVAGLDAGLTYNTWPLMDGALVPGDLLPIQPLWHNFFENPKTVQFVHRCFAYFVLVMAAWHAVSTLRQAPDTTHARRAVLFVVLIAMQAVIGIATLLLMVPIELGLLHQLFAIVVLGFAVAHWRATKGAYPVGSAA
ncbi:COX15/CtaA family protein [Phyllobacterium sp. 21LDTY02-6]|uniref:COX15/CtaA family protein n=1 Tax=unclassified Phyllobacterium TaxID=2638441 RepID=UPI002021F595|nr:MULTISPECIES: COX15/CtaA family protein [unclassified Phyllobacterium]MCO4319641.1 COX15/CtaA family protein [Phyllobacterium sp. 21LDTY02-6]MCX8280385.1 COX15/CtaA family protein [Phyllobacterium sp. 0TCS1.6C]MCX8295166.1 COX15/CtaA family protein [Phyllobacterium sp. 0TCS1.6A]